jgi:RsiW-degrading membrane proteinase PrsW (M82 family)
MLGLLALAIAPAIFVLCYFYLQDRYEPEPLGWVVKVFAIGALMVIPAALIESLFPAGLFVFVIVAPIVEESLKFSAVYFTVYRDEEFDEPVDGIVYAVAAALGFATIENILYVLEGGIAVGIIRAIASVPAHALFSSIWGYALGLAKFRPPDKRPVLIASGLAAAIFFHSVFNLLAVGSEVLGLIFILVLLVPFGWWLAHHHIGHAHRHPESAFSRARGAIHSLRPERKSEKHTASPGPTSLPEGTQPPDRFCSECGSPVSPDAKFCRRCGTPLDQ